MKQLQYPFDSAAILTGKRKLRKALLQKPGLVDKKIALLSGSTVGEIKNILELFLLDRGIRPTFWESGYGLYYESAVFDDGTLAAFAPDIIYIHTSNRNLRHWPAPGDSPEQAEERLAGEVSHFETLWRAALKFGCPVIQNNFELPLWRSFGNLDAWDARGRTAHVRRLNERMAAFARQNPGLLIHDLDYLASLYGLEAWCDLPAWYAYKYCCAVDCIPTLCHSLANLMGGVFGRAKKGVVLDLDNTLWGGVIGDDGAEGIELGDETPTGMAYAELQRYLKNLSSRGILLTVASKNEPAIAETGLARPDSPLKREDFVCFEANWNPKSESIAAIAQSLNILPESLVFLDDNPAEREQVAGQLPGVEIPEAGAPERSIALLDRGGYFEAVSVNEDDLRRGEMYRQNARRQRMEQSTGDYGEYLRGLEMDAQITPFAPEHVERITQLINKTNQFNLTTRRYTPAEVEACMDSGDHVTLSGRLTDKFGDNGIVSAIIGRVEGDTLDIQLWIMSCRVFKRHLEYAMFDELVRAARERGLKSITGRWLPTAKNLLVKDFYATIGFDIVSESESERVFRTRLSDGYKPFNTVIRVNGQ